MRRVIRSMLVAVVALGAVWSLPAAASAFTTEMGSALTRSFDLNGICTSNCVAFQLTQEGAPQTPFPLRSPVNGVVTQWAVRTSDDGALYTLRILRPAGGDNFTGAGTLAAPSAIPPNTTDAVFNYPGSLPIKQGDAIGVSLGGSSDEGLPQAMTNGIPTNVLADNMAGAPADGATATFINDQQHELLLHGTVEFCRVPSLKRFKKRAAKQALTGADCGVKVKKRPTHKRKLRGKVLKQKLPPGTTAAPGTAIPVVIGQK